MSDRSDTLRRERPEVASSDGGSWSQSFGPGSKQPSDWPDGMEKTHGDFAIHLLIHGTSLLVAGLPFVPGRSYNTRFNSGLKMNRRRRFAACFWEEDNHGNGHDARQRQQKLKDGMPSSILRQKTPNNGANGWRGRRCHSRPGHIGSTFSSRRDNRGHGVGKSDRPTATRTL